MSLFNKFAETKEEGFREEFVKPLLVKMGFIGITNKHGPSEFGKDYVFSELDRFGVLRNSTVQAKHEKTINQGTKVDELLSQIKQAFNCSYFLPTSPSEERFISSVYIFNTGRITDNAITQIRSSLPREWRVSTFFYDGHQLDTLSQMVVRRYDMFTRERLLALLVQLGLNAKIAESYRSSALMYASDGSASLDGRGFFLAGIESYLALPLIQDIDALNTAGLYWQCAKIVMSIADRYVGGVRASTEVKSQDMANLLSSSERVVEYGQKLADAIRKALDAMPDSTV